MARIYPDEPHPDTTSKAELWLFDVFKNNLPDDYVVFHSVAWQVRNTRGGIQDGETDFLIVNHNMDILVVEVKGGSIRCDRDSGKWFSNNNKIKDPFRQGRNAKYSILNKLKEIPKWEDRWFNVGNAVAFPDTRIFDDIRWDAPRELILDSSDAQKVKNWTEKAFWYFKNYDDKYRSVRYSQEDIETLVYILSPSWEFNSNLASELEIQENIIKRLTKDQFAILDFIERHRRVAISGCAGSGKTLVAIEKAYRLSKAGFSVLILCHNPYLAEFISSKVNSDLVKAVDFVSWIDQILGKSEEFINSQWSEFVEPSEEDLGSAFDIIAQSDEKYDAIIVDEGQDFRDTWWIVIESALRDPENSILYIFHDDNQALYLYGSQFKYPIQQAPLTLSKNCRNAGRIFELVKELHPQAPELSLELANEGVVKDFICTAEDVLSTVSDAVKEARNLIDGRYRLAILTAEIGSPTQSILNGREISIQEQGGSIPKWQEAVSKYMQIYDLSSNSYPTIDDIEKVTRKAREKLKNTNLYEFAKRYNFKTLKGNGWEIAENGRMSLRFSFDTRYIWEFFADKRWAKDILKIKVNPQENTSITLVAREGNVEKYTDENETYIQLYSVASFKGLEAHGIILFYWGHYPTGDELLALNTLYVGLSRAKHLLYFVSPIPLYEVLAKKDAIYSPDPDLFRLQGFS